MWTETRLTLADLAFSRGERALVTGLSLTVQSGNALALVGPNGSGKTSLLRVMAGLAEPDHGSVEAASAGYPSDTPRSAMVHLGGHQDGLKGALTVRQNLTFWQRYYGGAGRSIDEALAQLAVEHIVDLPAAVLSQGQKRRVALARLLVAPRPIWLLDEPTAALDAASTGRFLELVADHRAQGGIVIAATHTPLDLKDLQTLDLADYVPRAVGSDEPNSISDGESYWLEEQGR